MSVVLVDVFSLVVCYGMPGAAALFRVLSLIKKPVISAKTTSVKRRAKNKPRWRFFFGATTTLSSLSEVDFTWDCIFSSVGFTSFVFSVSFLVLSSTAVPSVCLDNVKYRPMGKKNNSAAGGLKKLLMTAIISSVNIKFELLAKV